VAVRKEFEGELEVIRSMINQIGEKAASFVAAAVDCLVTLDVEAAKEIRRTEREIDELYRAVDEKCVAIIATQQPMAGDLRLLIASIKIAGEIERIADYANNIAKRVQKKLPDSELGSSHHYVSGSVKTMGEHAVTMLREALRSYQGKDTDLAETVMAKDAVVDALNKSLLNDIINNVVPHSRDQAVVLELHTAIRYIERVADRATNIAEAVFYISTGFPYTKKR
jgi:phosphate transport system protein